MEAIYVSINRQMDKEDVVYTMEWCSCGYVLTKSCLTYYDPMDCSLAGSSVYGISHEYWNGLSFPSPGDLPSPGIEPASPALASGCFMTEQLGKLGTEYCSAIKRMNVCYWQQHGWTWKESHLVK